MDPEEALRAIRGLANANRFRLTVHAAKEAAVCGATRDDIRCALANARSVRASGKGRSSDWMVMGPDLDGDDFEIALILEDGILIITVY